MSEIATIGLDIAKNVFQLHAVDRSGKIVLRKVLRRSQVPGFFINPFPLPDRDWRPARPLITGRARSWLSAMRSG